MSIVSEQDLGMDPKPKALSSVNEDELVQRAQLRDEAAFAELMRRNSSTSFRLALSVLKDRQEAEDQVQTSFLKAWLNLPDFQLESRFSTWFRRIVLNQSLMQLRKKKRAYITSLDETDEDGRSMEPADSLPTVEQLLGDRQMAEVLRKEVDLLPPLLRDILILKDLQQMPVADAAARLGISEPAAKSRLLRARDMLRQRMTRHIPSTHSDIPE